MSAKPVWLSAISELPVPSLVPGKEEGMGRIGISNSFISLMVMSYPFFWCTEMRQREGEQGKTKKEEWTV